jgi:hypothetical protein
MRELAARRDPAQRAEFLEKRRAKEAPQQKARRSLDPEAARIRESVYYWRHPEKQRAGQRKYRERFKVAVFNHYGRHCVCCGEDELTFLSIDHIAGDGARKRSEHKSGAAFYQYLVKNGFPPGFQVLCFNCNFAKRQHKECPHSSLLRERQFKMKKQAIGCVSTGWTA